ncbi:MAG: hypothetical protein RLZ37_2061 [Actinomycetota bacterium]|jgi:hypothetical protein
MEVGAPDTPTELPSIKSRWIDGPEFLFGLVGADADDQFVAVDDNLPPQRWRVERK